MESFELMLTSEEQRTEHPVIELLEELIRKPSVTPEDAGCQEVLARRLQALGFECETMQFGDDQPR